MNLSTAQQKAIPLFLQGMKQKDIAENIGVTPQTICKWNQNPEFVAYINTLKWEIIETARDKLTTLAETAVDELGVLLQSTTNDEVKRKVILDILELTGIKNPEKGLFGWGIGPREESKIENEILIKKYPFFDGLPGM